MILVNTYYAITTEESSAYGDVAERGTVAENEALTFRELVARMRFGMPSCCPARGHLSEWVIQDQGETQAYFERGELEERTIHYSISNPTRYAKHWGKAMRCAGLIKAKE